MSCPRLITVDYRNKVSGFCIITVTFYWQTSTRFISCLWLRSGGTHLLHTWLRANSMIRIWWKFSSDTLKLPYISINNNVLSSSSNYSALSVLTYVTPLQTSSTALLFLSRKCIRHQNTVAWLIASVLYTFCNICDLSSQLFPRFTQNSVAHLCLKIYEISAPPLQNRFLTRVHTNPHIIKNEDLCTSMYVCMYVCIRGGPLQPLHRDPQWPLQ
jgi:cytochrome bd-type quinol oxidase subunit 2